MCLAGGLEEDEATRAANRVREIQDVPKAHTDSNPVNPSAPVAWDLQGGGEDGLSQRSLLCLHKSSPKAFSPV